MGRSGSLGPEQCRGGGARRARSARLGRLAWGGVGGGNGSGRRPRRLAPGTPRHGSSGDRRLPGQGTRHRLHRRRRLCPGAALSRRSSGRGGVALLRGGSRPPGARLGAKRRCGRLGRRRSARLTVRSFGIITAQAMPPVEVEIERTEGPRAGSSPPVRGSDAVFAAVAAAAWIAGGLQPEWPLERGRGGSREGDGT